LGAITVQVRADRCGGNRHTQNALAHMSSFSDSPKLIKGGLAATGAVKGTIALRYNPDTLTRSYQVQGVGGEGGGKRALPFRFGSDSNSLSSAVCEGSSS
jgi:hypothetical protein